MGKKEKAPVYLSDYEEDLIWMSYRYCIGRHTIAAHSHAGEIAKHAYAKLNPVRRNFFAFDIRREIESKLNFGYPAFRMETYLEREGSFEYRPLEKFIEFINGKPWEDLKKYSTITYTGDGNYDVAEAEKLPSYATEFSLKSDIDDLLVWMNLASLFDDASHHKSKFKNPNTGEIEEIEYFESWRSTDWSKNTWEKILVPIDRYLSNPVIGWRIDESCKVED
jgi:hypothetical protein